MVADHLRREAIAAAALARGCPECGAKAGLPCLRTIAMRPDGKIIALARGDGTPMEYLHQGRRFPTATGTNAVC